MDEAKTAEAEAKQAFTVHIFTHKTFIRWKNICKVLNRIKEILKKIPKETKRLPVGQILFNKHIHYEL